MKNEKKAAIYMKDVSDEQVADLRAWVVSKGFADITEYRDVTTLRRHSGDKEMGRLFQDAKERKFNVVFVSSLKQFGDYPTNVFLVIVFLWSCRVSLISRAEDWTDLSDRELAIMYFAYCLHQDSERDQMWSSARSRTKKRKNP
jgi:hypothetical protein